MDLSLEIWNRESVKWNGKQQALMSAPTNGESFIIGMELWMLLIVIYIVTFIA